MPSSPYSEVLAANIRAYRNRARLQQEPLAARMRALGFAAWQRQTIASVEKGRRRVTAEEVLGLAAALGTSVGALMSPTADDQAVSFPSGAAVPGESIRRSVHGQNDGSVMWDGEAPLFPEPLSTMHQLVTAGAVSWRRSRPGDLDPSGPTTGKVRELDPDSGEWVTRDLDTGEVLPAGPGGTDPA